jgi:hypothetical protein
LQLVDHNFYWNVILLMIMVVYQDVLPSSLTKLKIGVRTIDLETP